MEQDHLYELLQDLVDPKGTTHAGVVKTETEWIKLLSLVRGDCGIKKDWLRRSFPANEENIYKMLHEFRNWNKDWDLWMVRKPNNADDFVKHLATRYEVTPKPL